VQAIGDLRFLVLNKAKIRYCIDEDSSTRSLSFSIVFVLSPCCFYHKMPTDFSTGASRRAHFPPGSHPHPPHPLIHTNSTTEPSFSVEHGYFELSKYDDQKIYYQTLCPNDRSLVKSVIVMIHGYSDHCDFNTFNDAVVFVQKYNHCVVIFDQIGCGRSDGLFACIPDWFTHVDQVRDFIEGFVVEKVVRGFEKPLNLFAFGSSLGAAIAITLALRNPELFDGKFLLLNPLIVFFLKL
jgi:pimeloyl-ACP methyl ester carboxylesterase